MPTATVTKIPRKPSIGAMIDNLWELREEKRRLEAEIKALESSAAAIEEELLLRLDAEETTKSEGRKASISVVESTVSNVEDWDTLTAYIHRHKFYHLLQRRVSEPAMRELFEKKGSVPGVVPFTKRKLNLRSL